MPVRREDLRSETYSVQIVTAAGDLNLRIRRMDGDSYARFVSTAWGDVPEPQQWQATVDFLAGHIVEWDYLDEKGRPLPVTKENLLTLPVYILNAIAREITSKESQRGE